MISRFEWSLLGRKSLSSELQRFQVCSVFIGSKADEIKNYRFLCTSIHSRNRKSYRRTFQRLPIRRIGSFLRNRSCRDKCNVIRISKRVKKLSKGKESEFFREFYTYSTIIKSISLFFLLPGFFYHSAISLSLSVHAVLFNAISRGCRHECMTSV